jgi:hypothetical protein
LLSHTALDLNGAAHRIYDTAELSEHAIARVLDDLATMFADLGISESTQIAPSAGRVSLPRPSRSGDYIQPHQPQG